MMTKLDKDKADISPGFLILHLFEKQMEGYLDELAWGVLKKGMKTHSHRHRQKEVYIITAGRGNMQVDDKVMKVEKGDVVFIPPNSMHTSWNSNDTEDLEFIIIRSIDFKPWITKFVKLLSFA